MRGCHNRYEPKLNSSFIRGLAELVVQLIPRRGIYPEHIDLQGRQTSLGREGLMGSAGTHLMAAHWIVRYRHVIISDAGMAVSPLVAPGERGYWRVPYPDSQPCRPAGGGAF